MRNRLEFDILIPNLPFSVFALNYNIHKNGDGISFNYCYLNNKRVIVLI